MKPKIAIVGRPNVGKSSLFNRIIGQRISITDDMPGVTRDRIYGVSSWNGFEFSLIDTGGIELKDAPFLKEIKAQVDIAIDEADLIIFLCDKQGVTDDDLYISKLLYKVNKPIILAVNKIDDISHFDNIYDFYQLGFGDPLAISCQHGIGIGDLLDKIVELVPKKYEKEIDENILKFCVLGRTNVGKSSLVNAILNEERVIVSDIAGTTRDSINSLFYYNNEPYIIIDTAGLRKRGKVYENAEKYSVLRALDSLEKADIALLVLDANDDILELDKNVFGYAYDYNKACIIVVNKWDLINKDSKTMDKWIKKIRDNFKYLDYAPIVFVSALEKKRINTIFNHVKKIYNNYTKRITTSALNAIVDDATLYNPPGMTTKGRPKFYYATQVSIKPPTFVFFVNNPELIHFSYTRYLENQLRQTFDYTGTPIKIIYRKRE